MNKSQTYGLKNKADQLNQILAMPETEEFPLGQKLASVLNICNDLYAFQLESKPDITGATKQYLDTDKIKIDEIIQLTLRLQAIYKERLDLATNFSGGLQQAIEQTEKETSFFKKVEPETPIEPTPEPTPEPVPFKPVEDVSEQVDKTLKK